MTQPIYPITEDEQLLEQFVNRDEHIDAFSKLLMSEKKVAMSLAGKSGMGKTWLISRMIHECSILDIKAVRISYVRDGIHDYIGVMRQCRDTLDAKLFNAFTDLLNYYTVPQYKLQVEGNIEVARGAQFDNSSVGVIAGVYVRDLHISDLNADLNIPEAERRERLSGHFLTALAKMTDRVVIFLEGVELMAEQTQEWFWRKFVGGVVNQRLLNFRFVISGQVEAAPDHLRKPLVVFSLIAPLKREDVVAYLRRRGVRPEEIEYTATTLMRIYKGRPYDIAAAVSAIIDAYEDEGRTDA